MALGYTTLGKGDEKVIVLHDWLGDHTNYDPVVPYLDKEQFSYILADLRGYGYSKDISGEFTATEATQDILDLVDDLSWGQFHIISHSMTAMVAQLLASRVPERVKSIVAITPVFAAGSPMDDDTLQFMINALPFDDQRRQALSELWGDRLHEQWLEFKLKQWRDSATNAAVIGYLKMFARENHLEKTKGLKTPILVVVGESDSETYLEPHIKETFVKTYPNVEVVTCRNAAHYPNQEAPVFLASVITKFLLKQVEHKISL